MVKSAGAMIEFAKVIAVVGVIVPEIVQAPQLKFPAIFVIPPEKTWLDGVEIDVVVQTPVVFTVTKPTNVFTPVPKPSVKLPLPVTVVVPPTDKLFAAGLNEPAICKLTPAPNVSEAERIMLCVDWITNTSPEVVKFAGVEPPPPATLFQLESVLMF